MSAAAAAQLRVMAHMSHGSMNLSGLMNQTTDHYGRNGSAYRAINRTTALVQGGIHHSRADFDPTREWSNPTDLTEFTARMRCHAKPQREKLRTQNPSGYGLDEWCQDNMGGTAEVCECSSTPSEKELSCAAIQGWERPRTYLMYGCSASTFIGNATRTILQEAGLCPFDFINSRFRYATSNSNIRTLLPELLEGTLDSHQTAVLNVVPDDMDNVAGMAKRLHKNGTYMVHIFRENQLDELVCRTKGGWSTGGGERQTYTLKPTGVMRRLREEMDYRAKASRQMKQLGFGTVELTTEALTEYEFDDSERGWRRSLDAWHILMSAWGVKVPPGAIARGLRKAGRPQPPHKQHSATIENAHAVRDELARAGAPFDTWFREDESRSTPVSHAEKAALKSSPRMSLAKGASSDLEGLGDEPFPRLGPLRNQTVDLPPLGTSVNKAGNKAAGKGDAMRAAVDRMAAAREAAELSRQKADGRRHMSNSTGTSHRGGAANGTDGRPATASAAPLAPRNCYSIKAVSFNAWCASSCALNNCPANMCKCDSEAVPAAPPAAQTATRAARPALPSTTAAAKPAPTSTTKHAAPPATAAAAKPAANTTTKPASAQTTTPVVHRIDDGHGHHLPKTTALQP
jgi:hypothetical protein